jgi:hypothetical protein
VNLTRVQRHLLVWSTAGALVLPIAAAAQGRARGRQDNGRDQKPDQNQEQKQEQKDAPRRPSRLPQGEVRTPTSSAPAPQARFESRPEARPTVRPEARADVGPRVQEPRPNDRGPVAVPRASSAPRSYDGGGYRNDNGYYDSRGNNGYRPNAAYGPVYRGGSYHWEGPHYAPHFVGRGVIVPYNPVRFYAPYYAFRPRVALSFGISIGYPVAYPYGWYDPFAYVGAFPRPVYRSAYGGVSFDLDPIWGSVFVDGQYIGTADQFGPYDAPLTLPVGIHRVDIRANGYRTLSFDISVVSGQVIPYQGRMAWVR